MYQDLSAETPSPWELNGHHDLLRELVDKLLDEGSDAVHPAWLDVRQRPIRSIDSHIRTSELKTLGSVIAPATDGTM